MCLTNVIRIAGTWMSTGDIWAMRAEWKGKFKVWLTNKRCNFFQYCHGKPRKKKSPSSLNNVWCSRSKEYIRYNDKRRTNDMLQTWNETQNVLVLLLFSIKDMAELSSSELDPESLLSSTLRGSGAAPTALRTGTGRRLRQNTYVIQEKREKCHHCAHFLLSTRREN